MVTGWKFVNKQWYYFDPQKGHMKKGWEQVNGKWYYFYSNGVLAVDTTIDGWYVDKNGVCQDNKGEEIDYGDYTEEDYNYLVALGTECPTYNGFLAVAYSVINRADERNQSIREVVTAKNQYSGFRNSEIGNAKNEDVKQAAIDALSGAASNPIGKATFFFGRVNNYDIWYESTKCHYIREV